MNDNTHILAGNCIFVKGFAKNLLLDLQTQDWYHIDFDLPNNGEIELSELDNDTKTYLLENQIILEVPKNISRLFPKISYEFDIPSIIESAIIDRYELSKYSIKNVLDWLNSLCAKYYHIRYFSMPQKEEIQEILELTEGHIVESIDFLLPHSEDLEIFFVNQILLFPKINSVTFHSCDDKTKFSDLKVRYTAQEIISNACCGIIHPSFFSNNRQHILKSMSFNSCLYKKIGIDSDGNIKNCPSMANVLGHVDTIDILKNEDLETEFWSIKKDEIEICKDCEFRYICTDCRVRVESGIYSRPSTCPYNPYTNKWAGQIGYEDPLIKN